jgi:CRISPR-associated protein Cmr1
MGGLRSWYEIILRGLGYRACDPTSDNHCPKKDGAGEKRCDACQLFGCTGWRRRFSLMLDDGEPTWIQNVEDPVLGKGLNIRPTGRHNGWWRGAGRAGASIPLEIICHNPSDEKLVRAALPLLFEFCNRWTGLGAKLQHGFGVVNICPEGGKEMSGEQLVNELISAIMKSNVTVDQNGLPNLKDFFFAKVRVKLSQGTLDPLKIDGCPDSVYMQDQIHKGKMIASDVNQYRVSLTNDKAGKSLSVAPAVKNVLRYGLPLAGGINVISVPNIMNWNLGLDCFLEAENRMFGIVQRKKRRGSRVAISDAYPVNDRYEFRVWGWTGVEAERAAIYNCLKDAMANASDIIFGETVGQSEICWREMGSNGRCKPPCADPGKCASCNTAEAFLRCLLS